jgi:hypothetical protein
MSASELVEDQFFLTVLAAAAWARAIGLLQGLQNCNSDIIHLDWGCQMQSLLGAWRRLVKGFVVAN